MGKGGGAGGAPALSRDLLVKMLLQKHARAEKLSVENERLLAELEFQRIGDREREDIFQARIQRIWRDGEFSKRVEKAEAASLLGDKELELRCYQKFAEITENDLEDLRSYISTLAAENAELKTKLKEVESQAELSENNVDLQHSAKDLRAELRKLKQAYKTLSSEKDKEISALRAEKSFVWNQFKTMEQEYTVAIKNKNIEAKQATEAAQKLQQKVDKLQVSTQKKDDEISRLQSEVTNAKEKRLILENDLQQMRSSVKGNVVETDKNEDDQPETSRKCKKDINVTNRKSKSGDPILREKSVTPNRREVKTSRTHGSSAKKIQSQSRNSSCTRNLEERGQSKTSQKRKRGSLSHGPRRCSTKLPQVGTAASPILFPPSFIAPTPRPKTPTLP